MKVALIMKARNEGHILQRSLDNLAEYADAAFIYDDNSTDDTAEIARKHPLVTEVISSNYLDPDRLRAEWRNRQIVLEAARRFDPSWILYADADEWLYDTDKSLLDNPEIGMIAVRSYDLHITPHDEFCGYQFREWVGPEWELQPYFYRNTPELRWALPDQRTPYFDRSRTNVISGNSLHLGKGISIEAWEEKCRYYSEDFGKYAEKWENRKGKAVMEDMKSIFGTDLVKFGDVRAGTVKTHHHYGKKPVK